MVSVSMVSTAATFCCLACGISLGSSGSSDLFLFLSAMADTFQGAGGSSVPCAVWKEKQSKVRCPVLPHRQHPSLTCLCASISFWGTCHEPGATGSLAPAPVPLSPLSPCGSSSFLLPQPQSSSALRRLDRSPPYRSSSDIPDRWPV